MAKSKSMQVGSDGTSTTFMEAIVDHRRDDEKALQHHDKYIQTKNGRCHIRKTTKGWELLIKWKDKSESADVAYADMPIMNKLISANYWFGCDWVFYDVGYLGLRAGQLSLACAVIYLWNTGYLRVTRPRLYPGIQHTPAAQVGMRQVSWACQ